MNVSNYIEPLKVLQTMDDFKFIIVAIFAFAWLGYRVYAHVTKINGHEKCRVVKLRGQNIDLLWLGVMATVLVTGVWFRLRRI